MNREGWKVVPNFELPSGYDLHEDSTGVYLYNNDQLVAVFTHYADPAKIETIAYEHLLREAI